MVDFLVAGSVQAHETAKPGHNVRHYHLGRLRRLRVVVGGRHSPGSHLLRQDLTVAPPQLLLYLTSSAGSRIQSSILMFSMVSGQNGYTWPSQDRTCPATHSNVDNDRTVGRRDTAVDECFDDADVHDDAETWRDRRRETKKKNVRSPSVRTKKKRKEKKNGK